MHQYNLDMHQYNLHHLHQLRYGAAFGDREPLREDMEFVKKNLHRRIFRLKILHRQFHLISTVLVGKNTKK